VNNEVKIHDLPIPIAAIKTPSTTIVSITGKMKRLLRQEYVSQFAKNSETRTFGKHTHTCLT